MTTLNEARGDLGVVVSEANGYRSREQVPVAQDAVVYAVGTVMANNAGTYERFDGTNTAAAVLATEVDAIAAAADGTILARDAEVTSGELVWSADGSATLTGGQITAGTASLAAAGILVR